MNFDNQTDFNEIRTSKYNGAIAQLYRLDTLWQDAHRHSRQGKLKDWNFDLDRVWCELAPDATEKDMEKFALFSIEISKAMQINNLRKLYKLLLDKEIFLRILQNKQRKGTAYEDSIDEYMNS